MKIFISFGAYHQHVINGVSIGGNSSILCIDGVNSELQGRAIAQELLGPCWCTSYTDATYPQVSFAHCTIHTIDMTPVAAVNL